MLNEDSDLNPFTKANTHGLFFFDSCFLSFSKELSRKVEQSFVGK